MKRLSQQKYIHTKLVQYCYIAGCMDHLMFLSDKSVCKANILIIEIFKNNYFQDLLGLPFGEVHRLSFLSLPRDVLIRVCNMTTTKIRAETVATNANVFAHACFLRNWVGISGAESLLTESFSTQILYRFISGRLDTSWLMILKRYKYRPVIDIRTSSCSGLCKVKYLTVIG